MKKRLPLTGNRCYCSKCDEYFNSVAAFDHHLKSKRGRGAKDPARHDISGMPRNAGGYLVISLPSKTALKSMKAS